MWITGRLNIKVKDKTTYIIEKQRIIMLSKGRGLF